MTIEAPVHFLGRNAPEHAATNPCVGCSAPCCRLLLSPQAAPQTFMELDYLSYVVLLAGVELVISEDGAWQVGRWGRCAHLTDAALCAVHDTNAKPRTCVYFNPYNCWYKRNFEVAAADAPDVVRLDRAAYGRLLEQVVVAEDGALVRVPTWPELRTLVTSA